MAELTSHVREMDRIRQQEFADMRREVASLQHYNSQGGQVR